MSWLDTVDNGIIITCGDGKSYEPLWIRSSVEMDYNIRQWEFIEVAGTFVKRYEHKGARYGITVYFMGEDHLDTAARFWESSKDKRPWIIEHPLYGKLTVQPISLRRDDTSANVTEISGPFVETITENASKLTTAPAGRLLSKKLNLDQVIGNTYVNDLIPSSNVIKQLAAPTDVIRNQRATLNKIFNVIDKGIKNPIDAQNYFNVFTRATNILNDLTKVPLEVVRTIQAVINAPFKFIASVKDRVKLIRSEFDAMVTAVENIGENARDRVVKRKIFETNAATAVSSMASAAILQLNPVTQELTTDPVQPVVPSTEFEPTENPDSRNNQDEERTTIPADQIDYPSRADVIDVMESLMTIQEDFFVQLDALQSENGGEPDSYIPDFKSLQIMSDLINETVSQLSVIVMDSKQERIFILDKDMDIVSVTHRLLGMDDDDVNMNRLININNIGISELFEIRKGREITYLV